MTSVVAVELDGLVDRRGGGGGGRHHHYHRWFDLRERRDRMGGGTGSGSLTVDVRRTSNFPNHFSPALYATPEPSTISGSSPTPASPSPYVVNIKRRDFRLPPPPVSASNELEAREEVGVRGDFEMEEEEMDKLVEEEMERDITVDGVCGETSLPGSNGLDEEKSGVDEIDGFLDPRDSTSVMCSSDIEEGSETRRHVPGKSISVSTNSEFYDATEDFFYDNSSSHACLHSNTEADFSSLRFNLFEEIEKRENAERSLSHLQKKWKKTAIYFTHLGLPFPAIPDGSDIHHEADEIAQVYQETVVARCVSEALDRRIAHAGVEESMETIIKSKNREISRLHDRLQFYEAMNREMSQRNQKNIELARWKHQQRRKHNKLLWCSIGLSVTLGASLLVYSFKPQHTSIGNQ